MNENVTPNYRDDDDDVEIDLGELFGAILHRLWVILLVAVICAAATYAVSAFVLPEEYESTTQIYVLNRSSDNGTVTTSDLQAGTQLTKDYAAIITSRYVLEKVISNLNLDLTYEELESKVDVTTPTDTRIISITVTDTDPAMAQRIADEIRVEASEHIENVMAIDAVNIVEEANYPTEKSAPHNTRNAVIGGLVGLVAAMIIVIIRFISDDTIKTQEDVEKYLGLSVLAMIPLDEEISKNSVDGPNARKKAKKQKDRKGQSGREGGRGSSQTSRQAAARQVAASRQPGSQAGGQRSDSNFGNGAAAQEHHHARHASDLQGTQRYKEADSRENRARSSAAKAADHKTGASGNISSRSIQNASHNVPNENDRSLAGTEELADDETSVINLEDF